MYIPPLSQNLKDKKMGQIRLGLQGESGSFKTGAALTFPNPVFLDFDNGLRAYAGRDVVIVPFHDHEWVCSLENGKYKPSRANTQPNRRDALLWFLHNEAYKLTSEQTLVLDSWTTIQDAFDAQQVLEPCITKKGEIDEYDFWDKKIDYSEKIMSYLAAFKCHVIVTFHEMKERDKITGRLLDKIQPLMQGKFLTKLKIYYTDFFRAIAEDKSEKLPDGSKKVIGTNFFWQVRSDDQFTAKTRLVLPEGVMRVKPHYDVFVGKQ